MGELLITIQIRFPNSTWSKLQLVRLMRVVVRRALTVFAAPVAGIKKENTYVEDFKRSRRDLKDKRDGEWRDILEQIFRS